MHYEIKEIDSREEYINVKWRDLSSKRDVLVKVYEQSIIGEGKDFSELTCLGSAFSIKYFVDGQCMLTLGVGSDSNRKVNKTVRRGLAQITGSIQDDFRRKWNLIENTSQQKVRERIPDGEQIQMRRVERYFSPKKGLNEFGMHSSGRIIAH